MRNIILLFFCLISFLAFSQPGQNTNIFFTKIAINPAEAGLDNIPKFNAIGQNGTELGKETVKNYFFSIEKSINNHVGVSLQHSNFKNTFAKVTSTTLGVNKKFNIFKKSTLAIGTSVGYSVSKYDVKNYIKLLTSVGLHSSLFDATSTSKFGSVPANNLNKNNFTLGTGLFFNADLWSVGLSSPNVLKTEIPDITDLSRTITLKRQVFMSIDKVSQISEKWGLKTGILYASKLLDKDILYLNNSVWLNKKYGVGVWYKALGSNNNGNLPLTGIAEVVFDKLRFGYAYNFGKPNNLNTDLTQQLMFRIDIDYLNKNKNYKTTETP